MNVDRRLRFRIVMEAFFCFYGDVTTAVIQQWLMENKITGLKNASRSEINQWLRGDPRIKNVSGDRRRAIWRWIL